MDIQLRFAWQRVKLARESLNYYAKYVLINSVHSISNM